MELHSMQPSGLAFPAQDNSLEIHVPVVLNLGGLRWCGRTTAGAARHLLKDIWVVFGCYGYSCCEHSHVSFRVNPSLHFSGARGEEHSCGAVGDAGTANCLWGSNSTPPTLSQEAHPLNKEKAASKRNLLFSFSTFYIIAKEVTLLTSFVLIK